MNPINHLCHRQDLDAALEAGEYRLASLDTEGFIHASRPEQIVATANRYYPGDPDLLLLWIDPDRLEPELRWEAAHGELFPHIYGALNLEAILAATAYPPDPDGIFRQTPRLAQPPVLHTERLLLRPLTLADAREVQRLVGAAEIAATTLNIPHPYPDGAAERWILTHQPEFQAGTGITYAMTRREDGRLIGAIGLRIVPQHQHAEMGYWAGVPFWGQGYTTEAARALLDYGFRALNLHRIFARHFKRNPASGRVMQKIGMRFEGELREDVLHFDGFEDTCFYGILRQEWESRE